MVKSLFGPLSFALLAFGGLWGVFWLGHLLNTNWPIRHTFEVFTTWWTPPFTLTVGLAFSLFTGSITNLFSRLRKE